MAVGKCSECGGSVSTMATACPHCGVALAAPPAPVASLAARPAPRPEPERWPAYLGAVLVAVSAVLPWIGDAYGSTFGFKLPLAVMWDLEAPESLLSVGLLLLVLGAIGLGAASVGWGWPIRQTAAGVTVVAVVAVMVQTARFTYDIGGSLWGALNGLSIGPYMALAGGLVMLLAPIRPPKPAVPRAQVAVPAPTTQAIPTEAPTPRPNVSAAEPESIDPEPIADDHRDHPPVEDADDGDTTP